MEKGRVSNYDPKKNSYTRVFDNDKRQKSKKQLEIAMQMDPGNKKYQEAYGKLNAKNDYSRQSAQAQQDPYAPNNGAPVDVDNEQMGGNACTQCISCCYTYLCVNCLFNLCCGCR